MSICKSVTYQRPNGQSDFHEMQFFHETFSCKHEFHDNSVNGILATISVFLVYQYEWNWA